MAPVLPRTNTLSFAEDEDDEVIRLFSFFLSEKMCDPADKLSEQEFDVAIIGTGFVESLLSG